MSITNSSPDSDLEITPANKKSIKYSINHLKPHFPRLPKSNPILFMTQHFPNFPLISHNPLKSKPLAGDEIAHLPPPHDSTWWPSKTLNFSAQILITTHCRRALAMGGVKV